MGGQINRVVQNRARRVCCGHGTAPGTRNRAGSEASIDLHFVQRGLQAVNVAGVILHQFGIHVEVDDVGLVLVGKNLVEESAADLLLHIEDVALAAGSEDKKVGGGGGGGG